MSIGPPPSALPGPRRPPPPELSFEAVPATAMGAAAFDAADMIFRTQVLRPFLQHPGVVQPGGPPQAFLKPSHPAHRPTSRTGRPALQPFNVAETEDSAARRRRADENRREAAHPGRAPARCQLVRRPLRPALSAPALSLNPAVTSAAAVAASAVMGVPLAWDAEEEHSCLRGGPEARPRPSPIAGALDLRANLLLANPLGSSASTGKDHRRRPVCHDTLDDDEAALLSEEPEDPRVYLPAHRIGDAPPRSSPRARATPPPACSHAGNPGRLQPAGHGAKPRGASRSSPALVVASKKKPLHKAHKSCIGDEVRAEGRGSSARCHSSSPPCLLPDWIHQRLHMDLSPQQAMHAASAAARGTDPIGEPRYGRDPMLEQ